MEYFFPYLIYQEEEGCEHIEIGSGFREPCRTGNTITSGSKSKGFIFKPEKDLATIVTI